MDHWTCCLKESDVQTEWRFPETQKASITPIPLLIRSVFTTIPWKTGLSLTGVSSLNSAPRTVCQTEQLSTRKVGFGQHSGMEALSSDWVQMGISKRGFQYPPAKPQA